jgi:hypothetical protein
LLVLPCCCVMFGRPGRACPLPSISPEGPLHSPADRPNILLAPAMEPPMGYPVRCRRVGGGTKPPKLPAP